MTQSNFAKFNNLVDLAASDMGGEVLYVSDDFFASKDNLNQPGRGIWDPELFNERGKVYDGWESRRNRSSEVNDWVIIKLAARGIIRVVDVDTNHFLGNAPQFASVEGTDQPLLGKTDLKSVDWHPLLQPSSIRPGRQNLFVTVSDIPCTYVRLQIYPDGGVARLRLYGETISASSEELTDVASALNGGRAILASDMFFGEMDNLLKPAPPPNMGDGWETKRRRGDGHDWVIIKLGRIVSPQQIIVDTTHFKGNYPDKCSIEICYAPDLADNKLKNHAVWTTIVEEYKLGPDQQHILTQDQLQVSGPVSHMRLNIYPDGGIARLRVLA